MPSATPTIWDTSIAIDVLRGLSAAVRYAGDLEDAPVCSEITRVEILRGVRSPERAATERFLAQVTWIPLDESIARSTSLRAAASERAAAVVLIRATASVVPSPIRLPNERFGVGFEGGSVSRASSSVRVRRRSSRTARIRDSESRRSGSIPRTLRFQLQEELFDLVAAQGGRRRVLARDGEPTLLQDPER